MERSCRKCGKTQDETAFPKVGIIKGKQYYRAKCDRCYWRTKAATRTQTKNWWEDFKKSLVCVDCGEDDSIVLDFHHRNPNEKDWEVSSMVSHAYSKERILREADKCDVVCANCHRRRHHKEKLNTLGE